MYKKIAIITARSGSKGLPDKNILTLNNKPIISYTIEAAVKSNEFERIIVSTDSEEYKEISEKYGAEVIMRSKENSSDTATSYQVIEEVLSKIDSYYDYFMLLQPTSPFRDENHIKESIEKFEKNINKFDFLVSMTESGKSSGLFVEINDDESLKNMTQDFSNYRRQHYKEYHPNGAIFIGKIDKYLEQKHFYGKKSISYIMNKEDSIDIDDELDFEMAITIINRKNKKEILKNNIIKRIEEKEKKFEELQKVTLLGHSIIDQFEYDKINGMDVNNLGISGINTKEYNEYIFDTNKIQKLGEITVIMFGTNDIINKETTDESILEQINKIIENIKRINPITKIYYIEITPVGTRMDRKNDRINKLNKYLHDKLKNSVHYIEINEKLLNKFGKLDDKYTYDGLHLNEEGNKLLLDTIKSDLTKID